MDMIILLKLASWRYLAYASLLFIFCSESSAQFVEKNLVTGMTTRGNGLSCAEVYLSDEEKIIGRNLFIYGETFYVNFDGMEGFERVDGSVFPDMRLTIVSEHGDTVLHLDDLYAGYKEGIDLSPLQLYAEVTVANPVFSGETYALYVDIQDKRGTGSYAATLDFAVHRDDKIQLNGKQLSSREIYLFSQQRGLTITNGIAGFDENIYLLFEGLEGFTVNGGQLNMGLSMVVKDADENVILDEADLFGDSPLNYEDVHLQVASNFILTGSQVANPVSLTVRIWDKGSSAWISAYTEIVVE